MNIRKYRNKDFNDVVFICVNDMIGRTSDELIKYVETMFCRYYIEKEPENCFVCTDDNDKAVGYIFGVTNFQKYLKSFTDYIEEIKEICNGKYFQSAMDEIYEHQIYEKEYPAHLHINILPQYQSNGIGTHLITRFCNRLKEENIEGVMLVVDTDNTGARRFYEKNGFDILHENPKSSAYGKKLI